MRTLCIHSWRAVDAYCLLTATIHVYIHWCVITSHVLPYCPSDSRAKGICCPVQPRALLLLLILPLPFKTAAGSIQIGCSPTSGWPSCGLYCSVFQAILLPQLLAIDTDGGFPIRLGRKALFCLSAVPCCLVGTTLGPSLPTGQLCC